MKQIILKSVKERVVIKFKYDNAERIVHPVTYGESYAGNKVIRGFETSRRLHGKTEFTNDYKLYNTDLMTNIVLLETLKFVDEQKGCKIKDKAMKTVYCDNRKWVL